MKLSQDVRDLADAEAVEARMQEKAKEFREKGGEVYLPADGNEAE